MKQYYLKEATPLAFHKFFWYVSLPIGFIVLIGRMISEVSEMRFFNLLYAIDIGYYIIALTIMLVCFVGFFGWKSYAWYGVIIYLCLSVAYNLFAVTIYALYIPDQIGTAIGQLLGILIYAILVGIYYKKRRPLFFLDNIKVISEKTYDLANAEHNSTISYDVPPSIKYCRKCGFELLSRSEFCSKCGVPVVKE